jgi:cobalt-zinc-cadmium efflux system protein
MLEGRPIGGIKKSRLAFVVRLILGVIFIYASIDKIHHPADFAETVYSYQILNGPLINLTAIILPWLELTLGLLLILGVWVPGAVFTSNALLLLFFATVLFNLARGLDIDCGCFTASTDPSSGGHMLWYLFRDGFFLLLGLYLFTVTLFPMRGGITAKR